MILITYMYELIRCAKQKDLRVSKVIDQTFAIVCALSKILTSMYRSFLQFNKNSVKINTTLDCLENMSYTWNMTQRG